MTFHVDSTGRVTSKRRNKVLRVKEIGVPFDIEEIQLDPTSSTRDSSNKNDKIFEEETQEGGNCTERARWRSLKRSLIIAIGTLAVILLLAGMVVLILGGRAKLETQKTVSAPSSSTVTDRQARAAAHLEALFSVDLPSFFSDHRSEILEQPYGNNLEELHHDAEQLARYLVANEILSNYDPRLRPYCYKDVIYNDTVDRDGNPEFGYIVRKGKACNGGGGPSGTHLSPPFDANHQDETMHRQDSIAWNGGYLFVSEGDSIVVMAVNENRVIDRVFVPIATTGYNRGNGEASGWTYDRNESAIRGLLLPDNDRLVVLVSGPYDNDSQSHYPVLLRQGTRVILYSIGANGKLFPLSVRDLHGVFADAYSTADGGIHVVTKSVINKWRLLLEPVMVGRSIPKNKHYIDAAAKLSLEKTIPSFADELVRELSELGLDTNMGRFWIPGKSTIAANSSKLAQVLPLRGSFACRITSVHSLGLVSSKSSSLGTLSTTSVPTFGYFTNIYARNNTILLTDEVYPDPWEPRHTYFFAINVNGVGSKLTGIGSASGKIFDSYSVDVRAKGGRESLRLATTTADDTSTATTDATSNLHVFEFLSDATVSGVVRKIARVELGNPGEDFRYVQLLDDTAYAVASAPTNPVYAIDLTEPRDPRILGNLEAIGESFSEHVLPIGNQWILGVGRKTYGTDPGQLMVSLWDVGDPTAPRLIDRVMIEGASLVGRDPRAFHYRPSGGKGLAVQPMGWDERAENPQAFRYRSSGWGSLVVLPVGREGWEEFYVLSIDDEEELAVEMVIDHTLRLNGINWWECSRLSIRSLWLEDGKLLTFMGTSIVLTDLDTKEQKKILGEDHFC